MNYRKRGNKDQKNKDEVDLIIKFLLLSILYVLSLLMNTKFLSVIKALGKSERRN